MSRAEYLSISNKSSSGRPTRVYLEKADTIKAVFWPVPDSDSVSFSYAQVRFITEPANGSADVDLRRTWFKAVMLGVAAECARAKAMGLDLSTSLRTEAEALYQRLRANDMQRGPLRAVVVHNVNRWS
jgi:hypothetical protein